MPEGDLKNLPARAQSEAPALEVTMETPQKLYLRGAVYENYTGTAWESADTQKQADYEDLFYWLHESSFYGQSQIGLVEQIEGQRAQSMTVQTLDACGGHGYYPYAVAGSEMLDAQRIGDAELPAVQELHYYTGSVPRWYELQQTLVESQNTTAVSGYLAVEQEYAAYVTEMDLQMTQTSWEVLRRHIDEEDSGKTLGEIREIIRTYLDGAITYDESVGTYNGNSDFLQYVLERSGSGYDVHYATAATLLLRYFGVPARYVEGYFVSADEAALIQAGEPVTLDESHAHAWAEYYLNGVGFVPFEVTPGYIDDEEFELGGTQQSEYVYDGNQLRYAQVERPEEISELQQDPFVFSLNPLLLLLLLPLLLLAVMSWIGRDPLGPGMIVNSHLTGLYIAGDVVGLLARAIGGTVQAAWQTIWMGGLLAWVGTAAMMLWSYFKAMRLVTTTYRLQTTKPLPGGKLRVLQISDLHPGKGAVDRKRIPELNRRIRELNPDMILFTGDIFDEHVERPDFDSFNAFFATLDPPGGKWFVLGNHDLFHHWREP